MAPLGNKPKQEIVDVSSRQASAEEIPEAEDADSSAENAVDERAAPAPTLRQPCQDQHQNDAGEKNPK